ncbi:hypothetical protein E3N88_29987 [Mikania micrantha]|uniref:Uncharacterized protein n=1 Tax=Mikania micrantha TaxID=192012 RepID=A0A5N6MN80_9ASTR|nr:hypothetical protein E3N88_29987 [Mikania micrantha]
MAKPPTRPPSTAPPDHRLHARCSEQPARLLIPSAVKPPTSHRPAPAAPAPASAPASEKRDEDMRQSQSGAMYEFMNKPHVDEHVEEHVEVVLEDIEEEQADEEEERVQVELEETEEQQNVEENVNHNPIDIFDPIRWEGLSSDDIKLLVEKGPKRDTSIMYGPYDVSVPSGTRFSTALYT